MGRYLALDNIQPGDVILSAEPTLRSIAIRVLTGSLSSSHVAIAIHPLIWFEAVGEGLRYKVIDPELVWSGDKLNLAMRWPAGSRFKIRRPSAPLSDNVSREGRAIVAQRLIDVTSRFAFRDYARPEDFFALLRLGLGESKLAKRLASMLGRNRFRSFTGPFCSWLLAACYEAIHYPMFDSAAQRITPGAISRSRRFVTVPTVIRGVPIEDRAAFTIPVSNLRYCLALTEKSISSAGAGALLAKEVARANHVLRRVLKSGRRRLGGGIPRKSAAGLYSIDEEQKRNFEEFRGLLVDSLLIGYSNIESNIAGLREIGACKNICQRPIRDGFYCDDMPYSSCSLANEKFMEYINGALGESIS